jgi:predicted short-subunit dehydrogenase-like oxidoreductase (DUF2520 family)
MTISVNIIGAGCLGKTIGYLLSKTELVQIRAIYNRTKESTLNAIKFIGAGHYCSSIAELPAADMTLIATPDEHISSTSIMLSKSRDLKQESIVYHCSGSLTSEVLIAVKEKGCYLGSIHPMRSFATPQLSISQYQGTYCAMEGDTEAISTIRYLFNAIGSITYEIDKQKKSLYHAAGVFAANYLVTLAQQAFLCLQEVGIEKKTAMNVIANIMSGTVENLETLSPQDALTGPIKRGDSATIRNHLQSLANLEQKNLYSVLGIATLALTTHSDENKEQLAKILEVSLDSKAF